MSKIIGILIAICLVSTFISCSHIEKQEEAQQDTETETEPEQEMELSENLNIVNETDDFPVESDLIDRHSRLLDRLSKVLGKTPGGRLYASDLAGIETLDLSYEQIDNLDDIRYCVNLKQLDLHSNQIKDISPLSSLVNLRVLDISDNEISDIEPLSALNNLVELDINTTFVDNISALSNCTRLKNLNLSNTYITDFSPLTNLIFLSNLDASYLKVTSIESMLDTSPLQTLNQLKYLNLSGDNLTSIPQLNQNQNLRTLLLSSNHITSVNGLGSIEKLKLIVLDYNPLDAETIQFLIPKLEHEGVIVDYWDEKRHERILLALLKYGASEESFYIFDPELRFYTRDDSETMIPDQDLKYYNSVFKKQGYDFEVMLEIFASRNSVTSNLTIPSSQEDGYVIDYDGYFESYLERDLWDGWGTMMEENPDAGCFIEMSKPVYDKETGIILVYIGWQSLPLTGGGGLLAFRLDNGTLEEIASVGFWVS